MNALLEQIASAERDARSASPGSPDAAPKELHRSGVYTRDGQETGAGSGNEEEEEDSGAESDGAERNEYVAQSNRQAPPEQGSLAPARAPARPSKPIENPVASRLLTSSAPTRVQPAAARHDSGPNGIQTSTTPNQLRPVPTSASSLQQGSPSVELSSKTSPLKSTVTATQLPDTASTSGVQTVSSAVLPAPSSVPLSSTSTSNTVAARRSYGRAYGRPSGPPPPPPPPPSGTALTATSTSGSPSELAPAVAPATSGYANGNSKPPLERRRAPEPTPTTQSGSNARDMPTAAAAASTTSAGAIETKSWRVNRAETIDTRNEHESIMEDVPMQSSTATSTSTTAISGSSSTGSASADLEPLTSTAAGAGTRIYIRSAPDAEEPTGRSSSRMPFLRALLNVTYE